MAMPAEQFNDDVEPSPPVLMRWPSDLEDEREEFIAGAIPDDVLEQAPITIAEIEQANILLRRLRRIERKRDEAKALYRATMAEEERFRDGKLDQLDREEAWITRVLDPFMRAHYANTHEKTLDLSQGKLSLTKTVDHVEVTDEAAFLEWESTHDQPTLTRRTVVPAKDGLMRWDALGNPVETTNADGETVVVTALIFETKNDEGKPVVGAIPGVHLERAKADRFKATPRNTGRAR